jgi:hypothetical protein
MDWTCPTADQGNWVVSLTTWRSSVPNTLKDFVCLVSGAEACSAETIRVSASDAAQASRMAVSRITDAC